VMAANDGPARPTPPATGVALTIRELRVSTNLNCCVCYLKLGDTTRALDFAERAIALGIIPVLSIFVILVLLIH
jgi:hypothetical protein